MQNLRSRLLPLLLACTIANLAPLGNPFEEAILPDLPAVQAALQEHAKGNGFAILVNSSNAEQAFYICSKGRKYNPKCKVLTNHPLRQRRNTSTIKTRCLYRVVTQKEADRSFKTQVLDNNHNHSAVAALSAEPQHRIAALTLEGHVKVKNIMILGHSPGQILNSLLHNNNQQLHLIPQDIYNLLASLRVEELNSKTPVE